MAERDIWEYQGTEPFRNDGLIEAVLRTDGAVHFSVTEEKAVDSYNSEFTCSVTVPRDQLAGLKELIERALAAASVEGERP